MTTVPARGGKNVNALHVEASTGYDVFIGGGLLTHCGETAAAACGGARCAMIVSDSSAAPLYAAAVRSSFEAAGLRVSEYVFPAGERSKNLAVWGGLLERLAEERMTRTDILVALGGGVVGDLTGFAAASYLRGIRYVQIPTTLLAAVDSSVGGKTAVDLPTGKNLAGAFWQPSLVLCDTDTLQTLPDAAYRDGCAEVIKYGALDGEPLLSELEASETRPLPEKILVRCVEIKRDIVAQDERDAGTRKLLNLGHTFGHAIETCSAYTVSHGQAVAIGTAMAFRAAANKEYCRPYDAERIEALLRRFGLPAEPPFGAEQLYEASLADKKREGGSLSLIVPRAVGDCGILSIPEEDFLSWLRAGGAA